MSKQLSPQIKAPNQEDTYQWEFPLGFNLPQASRVKYKQEGRLTYNALRNYSVHYPIARSCIDYIKTKVVKLDWAVVNEDDGDGLDRDDGRVIALTEFFKHPMGRRSKYRELIDQLVEDYLVIGYFTAERMRTRGGQFLGELKPVDATTIRVLVDEHGRVPQPPNIAYYQYIRGKKVAELTQDDLILVNKNVRTNNVFGLSPIESLLIQVESALKGSLSSLAWFSEGNVPEGFMEMPSDWTAKQIKEFQNYFDSLLAGNPKYQRRIKMVPNGSNYEAVKKPSEINFDRFEKWLMKQTCSVFGVPPSDIGFEEDVNRATGEVQAEKGQERAMLPLVQTLEETFTDIIQNDFGYRDLEFKFLNVDPVDKKLEAEIDKMRLDSGIMSVDEVRARDGFEPIGVSHYISNGNSVVFVGKEAPKQEGKEENTEDEEMERADIVRWRKHSLKALKQETPFKKFDSDHLDEWMIEEIYTQLQKCTTKEQVQLVFDPYLSGKMQAINQLAKISNELVTKIK